MFTGIIESLGEITAIEKEGENYHFTIESEISKELKIEYYNPNNLEQFSKLLKNLKKDVLVVGHSNTTCALAGLLIGEEIGEFDLNIYNRVYQVVVSNENSRLHLLHTAFKCED